VTPGRAAIVAGAAAIAFAAVAAWWLLRDAASAAPTNVRIVQSDVTAEQWIRWDDNADGEAGYRGSVRLLNDTGGVVALSDFNTPRPGESQSPVTPFDAKFARDGCYDAVIRVEAIMRDGEIVPADDAAVRVCIEGGTAKYTPFQYVPERLDFPTPEPGLTLALTRIARDHIGNYSLAFEEAAKAKYMLTTTRVYTEAGELVYEAEMDTVPGGTPQIPIDAGEGLRPPTTGDTPVSIYDGCYRREFVTWTIDGGVLRGWSAISRLPVCYGEVESFFPTIDNPEPVIPASTSNVGIVRDSGGQWTITWDDNSANETAFEILVSIFETDGQAFVVQQGITAGADQTTAAFPSEALSLPARCYQATVYVFSERFDSANGIPGNARWLMCVDGGDLNFAPFEG
jgi:hypothetical protein